MKTLLVIDDSAQDRELVRIALGKSFVIDEAGTAAEGLEKLQQSKHHVVLLDLVLQPPIDPSHIVKDISKISPYTAIVVFSGTSNPQEVGASMLAGADAFVKKPTGLISEHYMTASLDAAIMHRMVSGKRS